MSYYQLKAASGVYKRRKMFESRGNYFTSIILKMDE